MISQKWRTWRGVALEAAGRCGSRWLGLMAALLVVLACGVDQPRPKGETGALFSRL